MPTLRRCRTLVSYANVLASRARLPEAKSQMTGCDLPGRTTSIPRALGCKQLSQVGWVEVEVGRQVGRSVGR